MVSFNELSFNELSFDELSFNELSFNELSSNELSFNELSFTELSFNKLSFKYQKRVTQTTQPGAAVSFGGGAVSHSTPQTQVPGAAGRSRVFLFTGSPDSECGL